MSNREHYPLVCDSPERVVIAGSFAPNGSSAISAASNKGDRGWSVAYISTGLYRITFDDTYNDLVYFGSKLQLATGADQQTQEGTWTSADRTQDVRVWDASDAAVKDIAADANNRINFVAVFKNTNLTD
jgi:hypothetical protein